MNEELIVDLGGFTYSDGYILQEFHEAAVRDDLEQIQEMVRQGAQFDAGIIDAAASAQSDRVLGWLLSDDVRRDVLAPWGWDWVREDVFGALQHALDCVSDDGGANADVVAVLHDALVRWDRDEMNAVAAATPDTGAAERPAPAKRVL
jgi:hypothetical protein